MRKNIKLFLSLLWIFLACGPESRPVAEGLKEYYDLESLVDSQIVLLQTEDPQIIKTVQVNDEVETETLKLGGSWSNELEIFKNAQINKPAFAGRYKMTSHQKDGLKSMMYEPIEGPVLGIEYLKISYSGSEEALKCVEVFYNDENLFYKSSRKLTMNFAGSLDNNMISSYSIMGVQKMLFVNLKTYKVEGIIKY